MEFQKISAVVTGSNGQQFHGYITTSHSAGETIYHFTFDGGFEVIRFCKISGRWIYSGGMRIPNEHWIEELGLQIDTALKLLPDDSASDASFQPQPIIRQQENI